MDSKTSLLRTKQVTKLTNKARAALEKKIRLQFIKKHRTENLTHKSHAEDNVHSTDNTVIDHETNKKCHYIEVKEMKKTNNNTTEIETMKKDLTPEEELCKCQTVPSDAITQIHFKNI